MSLDLSVQIGPMRLKNPIMTASGTCGYGLELASFCPPAQLGAVVAKGVSLAPWPGNPSPRMAEAASGLINAIGLENMGVEAFVKNALPPLKETGATVGANILGHSPEEYAALAARLSGTEVDFLEVNVSCPNVAKGGFAIGATPEGVAGAARAVRENCGNKPFVVKLTPMTGDIESAALAAEEEGAAAVSLINTVPAMAVDLERRRPKLANVTGGLSGPAVKPIALRQVWLCARRLKIPVIGLGGIFSGRDALEFIMVGAGAVQIGTAALVDPRAPMRILEEMRQWMQKEGLDNLEQLRASIKI